MFVVVLTVKVYVCTSVVPPSMDNIYAYAWIGNDSVN